MYQTKVDKLKEELAKISVYQNDDGVLRMLEIARIIYGQKLDIMSGHVLIRLGGELSGLYISFGNKASQARADHEITSNVYKQVLQLTQQNYLKKNELYKVTEAKNLAGNDLVAENDDVILKEAVYEQWKHIIDTCKTLIMFIQSALASRKSETFIGKNLHDNNNQ